MIDDEPRDAMDVRVEAAYGARTRADLARLVADLTCRPPARRWYASGR